MDNTMSDAYYLKARDYYPYEVSVVVENLGYALSYDEDHPGANTLMGQVYVDQHRFEEAEYYFERAIRTDVRNLDALYRMGDLMVSTGRFTEAYKVISYAMKISGADRFQLLRTRARAQESQGYFNIAIASLEEAVEYSFTSEDLDLIKMEIRRLKRKRRFVSSRKVHLAHP